MKKLLVIGILIGAVIGCESVPAQKTSTDIEREKQETLSKQAIESVGLPNISNFYEKKTLKKILEMRDNPKLINYFYTKNNMSGKWVYEGKCIGFGISYTTQYTNPEKITITQDLDMGSHWGDQTNVIQQADPNGLYSVPNGTATWIMRVTDDGKTIVDYIESEIRVSQNKIPARLCEKWSLPENY
ncbi:MAG: hypothetical protein ACLSVP_00635 [Fusobacterium sp.]